MKSIKKLFYLGKDEESSSKIQEHAQTFLKNDYYIDNSEYQKDDFFRTIVESQPNVIYVDFNFISEEQQENLFQDIVRLKRIEGYRSILFVAILSDFSNKKNISLFYSTGFQIGCFKDKDFEISLIDSLYIAFDDTIKMPQFARAKCNLLELKVSVCSSLSCLSQKYFLLETDLPNPRKALPVDIKIWDELTTDCLHIKAHHSSSLVYPMTESYQLKIPFLGPWDETSNEKIKKEKVEKWIDENQNLFQEKSFHVKIVNSNPDLKLELFSKKDFPCFLHFEERIKEDMIKDCLLKKYPLIFIEIKNPEDEMKGLDSLSKFVEKLQNHSYYEPILIIQGIKSKAEALQKIYRYKNIVCTETFFSIDTFELFVKKFREKHENLPFGKYYYFYYSDKKRVAKCLLEIQITSLTEHEITFASETELPMFSVLHLELPLECFVTLVPNDEELEKIYGKKHYRGFIHSLSEEERKKLRIFVNQIIYNPIKSLTKDNIESILRRKDPEKEIQTEAPQKTNKKEEIIMDYKSLKKEPIKGKSKL